MRVRHRPPVTFYEGQLIYAWRQPRVGSGRWHGPGVIVLPTAGGAWVNMRGALWRVSNEQMRPATQDESKGIEVVNQGLDSMRIDLQSKRGPKKFLDVRREGEPVFEDPDIIEEDHQSDDDDETRALGSRLSQLETPAATENLNLPLERFGENL